MLRVRRLPRQDVRPDCYPSPFYFYAIGHACAIACADDDARAVYLLRLQPDARCRSGLGLLSPEHALDHDHGRRS